MQQQQADGSYQELWPKVDGWNKSQVLSESTANILGLSSNYIPDDAFLRLYLGDGNKVVKLQVYNPDKTYAVGCSVEGLTALPGRNLITNSQGIVLGIASQDTTTVTIKSLYVDIEDLSATLNTPNTLNSFSLNFLAQERKIIKYTSSSQASFSPFCKKIDVCLVGGGGGAGSTTSEFGTRVENGSFSDWPYRGSGGGGGGQVVTQLSIDYSQEILKWTVGSGRELDSSGGISILYKDSAIIAQAHGRDAGEKEIKDYEYWFPNISQGVSGGKLYQAGRKSGSWITRSGIISSDNDTGIVAATFYQGENGTAGVYPFGDTSLDKVSSGGGGAGTGMCWTSNYDNPITYEWQYRLRGLNGDGVSRACGFFPANGSGDRTFKPTFSFATQPILYGSGGNGGLIKSNQTTNSAGTPGKQRIVYFRLHY